VEVFINGEIEEKLEEIREWMEGKKEKVRDNSGRGF